MVKQHHHGSLREALIKAGLTLLHENGADGLSIRKVAALAGVSHAAPAHHFASLTDLRTAVIATGYRSFANTMLHEIAQIEKGQLAAPPRARILAAYRGYTAFATDNPALFQMMFGGAERNGNDPDLNAAAGAAMDVLRDICAPIVHGPGGSDTNELMIWSLVHGFASLALTDNSGRLDITDSAQLESILPPLQFIDEAKHTTKDSK